MLRGTEPILLDFMDRPEHLHAIAERFTQVRLAELDILEEQGLLGYGLDRIHCTGAHTTELPKPGFDPAKPRAVDNWTVGRSQLFVSVGDAIFDEFVPGYYAPWYARFGLGYFGCCDPLHNRIDWVRKIPNVRKISMSAWAKVRKGAESIGSDFVFSRKPNPAMVAMDEWVPRSPRRTSPRHRGNGANAARSSSRSRTSAPAGTSRKAAVGVVRHRGADDPRLTARLLSGSPPAYRPTWRGAGARRRDSRSTRHLWVWACRPSTPMSAAGRALTTLG